MSKKKYNKARPGHYKPGANFAGYKKGYEPKLGKFRDPAESYQVNERAIAMLKEYDEGGGFKKGSGAKAHRVATDKLRELEFDPLEKLIDQLDEIEKLLNTELSMTSPRIMVVNNLINCKTRILENLLPYRYGKAPTLTVESADIREPIRIVLEHDFTINDKAT
jgi:hypothetical protein